MKKVLFLMLALDLVIHYSFAQGTSSINKLKFNNGPTLGKNGYGCAIGDLNSDGYPDIYIANADLGSDQVWFNDGKGGFVNSGQNIGGAVKRDRCIAIADLNGDGYLDVFLANDQIGNPLGCPNEVWLNDGTGKFSDSGQRLGNLASSEVALGDIDGDGDIDAIIANLHDLVGNDQSNEIWLNDSKGNFTNSLKNLGGRSYTVTLADVNNDAELDIIFGCIIWINNGNLKFTERHRHLAVGKGYILVILMEMGVRMLSFLRVDLPEMYPMRYGITMEKEISKIVDRGWEIHVVIQQP